MNIAASIIKRIEIIEPGEIFTYRDFGMSSDCMEAMAATFSRLASKGIIKRFGKGKYFKPKTGMFGEVPLNESQILESILKEKGHLIGYLTGTPAYNQMGLTTQVSNEYIIAAYQLRKPIQRGRVNVRFVKAYADIKEKNIPLLQLLDAIKEIKNISGTEPDNVLELLKIKIKELSLTEQTKLAQLALNYPPATRALTGAMLDLLGKGVITDKLYKSLNFLSRYKLGIKDAFLPNKEKWRIE